MTKGAFMESHDSLTNRHLLHSSSLSRDPQMRAIQDIQPQFKAMGRIRAFETLCLVAFNYLLKSSRCFEANAFFQVFR